MKASANKTKRQAYSNFGNQNMTKCDKQYQNRAKYSIGFFESMAMIK